MIGFYLHHHGSGHRLRGMLIAQEVVRAGVPVTGAGSGPPPAGWPGAWVDLVRDDALAQPGGPDPEAVDASAGGVLHWAPLGDADIARRQQQVTDWLVTDRPSTVLVDVSVEIALQVRLCGVPVVVTALPGERTDRPHATAYDLADHLLAPWPEGTHELVWPAGWRAKTWATGAISRFAGRVPAPARPVTDGGGRTVLVVWGAGGTVVDAAQVAAAAAATPGWTWVHRGGPHEPSLDLWAELMAADVVVTHAGQNAVADVACAARPAVVVAQPRPHGEQEATARAVQRLGIARRVLGWPEPAAWPALLTEAVARGGAGWERWVAPGAAARAAAHLIGGPADGRIVAGDRVTTGLGPAA